MRAGGINQTVNDARLKLYVLGVGAAALVAIATLPAAGFLERPLTLPLLLALAAAGGARSTRIASIRIQVTLSDLFLFCAIAVLAPLAVPLVALAGVTGALLGPERRPLSLRTIFNLATVPLSAALAARVFLALDGHQAWSPLDQAGPLLVAGGAFYAANLILVALVIHLETGRGVLAAVARFGPWTAVSCLTSLLLGMGLLVLVKALGPLMLVLGFVATGPMAAYLREQKAREEDEAFEVSAQPAAPDTENLPA
jgi:hypothetical protein